MPSPRGDLLPPERGFSMDLHLHTNYSDGRCDYTELFDLILSEKVALCSVTDHDTIEHTVEIANEAKKRGLFFLPGVEISTFFEGGEVHILGYGFSLEKTGFHDFLKERFSNRSARVREMIGLLNSQGISITYDDVLNQSPGPYVGRPNIARAMKNKGFIRDTSEAFSKKYIGSNGRAYVPPSECHPGEAIRAIRDAGGFAVLAHPGLFYSEDVSPLFDTKPGLTFDQVSQMKNFGLEGIECYHSKHSYADSQKYVQMCQRLYLVQTMGSDFHEGMYYPIHWQVPKNTLEETFVWLKERFSFLVS